MTAPKNTVALTANVRPWLKETFEYYCQARGKTVSKVLSEMIESVIHQQISVDTGETGRSLTD